MNGETMPMNTDPKMSAQPCGCDPGANYNCERHRGDWNAPVAAPMPTTPPVGVCTADTPSTAKVPESGGASLAADLPYAHAVQEELRQRDAQCRLADARELVQDGRGVLGLTPPKGQKPTNAKGPFATNKVPLSLWPMAATVLGTLALADGGAKYGIANYRAAGVSARIYIDALLRHIAAWYDGGEDVAEDSGVPHLGHALACLAIIVDAQLHGVLKDDRPMSNAGLVQFLDLFQDTIREIRVRHRDKDPRHFTIADNGIGTVPDPKTRS